MKSLNSCGSISALITHVTVTASESVNSKWAVAMSILDDGLFPLSVVGEQPPIEACVRDIDNFLWRQRGSGNLAGMQLLEVSGAERPDVAPRIICPLTVGSAMCLLAFGPRRDGLEYSMADRALLTGLTGELSVYDRYEEFAASPALPGGIDIDGIDYYAPPDSLSQDLLSFEPSSLFVSLASEPNTPAPVIMAGIRASLRALAAASTRLGKCEVSNLVCELNRIVRELAPRSFLAALFLGHFDSARQQLRYVNAGFQSPLLIRGNKFRAVQLEPTAAMLGLTDAAPCWHRTMALHPRDVFVALPDDSPAASERAALDVVLTHRDASSIELAGMIAHRLTGSASDIPPVVVVRATEPRRSLEPFGALTAVAA